MSTWIVRRHIDYEGEYDAFEGTSEEVYAYLGKQSGQDREDMTVLPSTVSYDPSTFEKLYRKGQLPK